MRLDPIVIVAYDHHWAENFECERVRLEAVLGPVLIRPIEHIGSTAVPGLSAKPIIDMLAVVTTIDDAAIRRHSMDDLGWIHAPEPDDSAERRMSFCTPSKERRSHHLHVVEDRHPAWRGWLAFRDHLRAHGEVVAEYAELKRTLAVAHGCDPSERVAYRRGKAGFIRSITATALRHAPD